MRNYRDFVTEKMQIPEEAAEYLRCSLDEYFKDGSTEAFLAAIRTVAEAQGGIAKLSKKKSSGEIKEILQNAIEI